MKNNPVAKYADRFNKAAVHRDKTKYNRKEKHRRNDASLSSKAGK